MTSRPGVATQPGWDVVRQLFERVTAGGTADVVIFPAGDLPQRDGYVAVVEAQQLAPADADRLCEAVFAEVDGLATICLVSPGTLPRAGDEAADVDLARAAWHDGRLAVEFEVRRPLRTTDAPAAGAVASWLSQRLAETLGAAPADVPRDVPLAELGLESVELVEVIADLESWLGDEVPPTVFWRHPTIATLSAALGAGAGAVAEPSRPKVASGHRTADAAGSIAIVGIGCTYPGAVGVEAFWRALREGRSLLEPPGPEHPGSRPGGAPRRGAFLEDPLGFDERFFRLSPREAARMDPQHRLLLDAAWTAFEDAGIAPASLANTSTGVFVGISNVDFQLLGARSCQRLDGHMLTGSAHSMAANRISYLFDLHGPSMAIDTACSSSLLSVHLACRSLQHGESSLALAGGVNLLLMHDVDDAFEHAGMLARDGVCRTFDAAADGYVRGEGVGLVVLKRLDDAIADGDRVYAVVAGSATVQDGRSNGLTAPNGVAQEQAIRQSLADADVIPDRLGFVEAHGTGTPLGDPVEVEALGRALGSTDGGLEGAPCFVGSVKTNLGHLEAAAGVTGLIKAALVLRHRLVPPNLHIEALNPAIRLGDRLRVPTELVQLPDDCDAAGVSSFGFGGANVHVTLVAPPPPVAPTWGSPLDPPVLLASAHTPSALEARAAALTAALGDDRTDPADVRYTANARRQHLRHRQVAMLDEESSAPDVTWRSASRDDQRRGDLGIVFGGQGALAPAALVELLGSVPVAAEVVAEADQRLGHRHGATLTEWLGRGEMPTDVAQPALYAVGIGCLALLESLGVEAAAVCGHSVGELTAATAAGALAFEDGLAFAAERGRLMAEEMPPGGMAAVLDDEGRVEAAIAEHEVSLEVAASHGPGGTIVAGDEVAIDELVTHGLGELRAVRLPTDRAFHSRAVDPCLRRLRVAADDLPASPTKLALASTLDGSMRLPGWIPDAEHWVRAARHPVRFDAAVRAMAEAGCTTFVEVGFGAVLSPWGRRLLPGCRWLPLVDKRRSARASIADMLASLFEDGVDLDLTALYPPGAGTVVSLPPYPFQRRRRWLPAGDPAVREEDLSMRSSRPTTPPTSAVHVSAAELPERAAVQPLRRVLAGFGAGEGDHVVLHDLTPVAADVARAAASAIGATVVDDSTADRLTGRCFAVAQTASARRPDDAPSIVVDADGHPTGSMSTKATVPVRSRPRLSLAFFGEHARGGEHEHYRHIVAVTRRADQMGFHAVWTPERHFDSFGGAFPAPAVLSAALARETDRIRIRAGSVVLPLTHPVRVVEQWALVDNLSDGRVDMAFASGWRDRDRVLAHSGTRPDIEPMIEAVRRLWRGDEVEVTGPDGHVERVSVRPAPVQPDPPLWLTVMRKPESWNRAARLDMNILTNLIGRSVESLGESIETYRKDRAGAGVAGPGQVTVFLHAHVEDDARRAREAARGPLEGYLAGSASLFSKADDVPWLRDRLAKMDASEQEKEIAAVASMSARRYLDASSMIGNVESCAAVLDRFGEAGVDEVACLLDFGMAPTTIMPTIERLADLVEPEPSGQRAS